MADLASLLIRFHLFEVKGVKAWGAPISRLDARGIRSPLCLQRIPYAELVAAGWELPHPDMSIWIWQTARRDSSPFRITGPHSERTPPDDFRRLIRPLQTDNIVDTDIGEIYSGMGREFDSPHELRTHFDVERVGGPQGSQHCTNSDTLLSRSRGKKEYPRSIRRIAPTCGARDAELSEFPQIRPYAQDSTRRAASQSAGNPKFRINRNSGFPDRSETLVKHTFLTMF